MNIENEFDMLWQVVDKKTAKQVALKAFKKNFKALYLFAKSQNKTIAQVYKDWKYGEYKSRGFFDKQNNLDKSKLQFLCHLATWLNGHRWEDEHFIPEPEAEEIWFNTSTGIMNMGASMGLEYNEEEESFPSYKKRVLQLVKSKFGSIKGSENAILSTRH